MTSASMHRAALDEVRSGTDRDVVFVEMTVYLWRDTPSRLHAYERLFGALPDSVSLTGTPRVMKQLWGEARRLDEEGVRGRQGHGLDDRQDPAPSLRRAASGPGLHPLPLRDHPLIRLAQPDARMSGLLPPAMRAFLSRNGVKYLHSPELDSWTASDVEKALTYLRQHAR